ncbi:MAG: acetyl-CoA carboxylase, carboxyltransferase subunit beta [Candidatus Margulisbacteria bacterium]|nr:acetyl-CoA carboxylase, carboxyltransferase subunit beta [Candidatus Margulisiibacteriota bacterium]
MLDWLAERQKDNVVERERLDIPGDLWIKCFKCGEVLYNKDLESNLKVCTKCNHHFRLTANERIKITFDEGSVQETDGELAPKDFLNFKDTTTYAERITQVQKKTQLKDAVVTGIGKIEGFEVSFGVMDFGFMGGSMGSVVGEKVARAIERGIEKNLPVIMFTASGGARMQEGIMSLMQMAKTSAALSRLEATGLLYIVVHTDPTTAGVSASFAMLGDVHIAEPNALIGFAGPRVIEQTIRQKLPKGFQRSEYLVDHGYVDHIVERKEMRKVLANIIKFATIKVGKE